MYICTVARYRYLKGKEVCPRTQRYDCSQHLNPDSGPFKAKVIIGQPHKVKTASPFSPVSGCGLPQLYADVEAGYVQVDVGQEHVTCLSLLAELSQQFTSPPAVKKEASEVGAGDSDDAREGPEHAVLYQSFDDIRAGCFRYVTASGNAISGNMIWP